MSTSGIIGRIFKHQAMDKKLSPLLNGKPFEIGEGVIPVQQVFVPDVDFFMAKLTISEFKRAFGTVDMVHKLRSSSSQLDHEVLSLTTQRIVLTCWDYDRLHKALVQYLPLRKLQWNQVRIYQIGRRML